jgi:hypothetical protein
MESGILLDAMTLKSDSVFQLVACDAQIPYCFIPSVTVHCNHIPVFAVDGCIISMRTMAFEQK